MPSPRADGQEREPAPKMRAPARLGAALCLSLSGLACSKPVLGSH